jgi:hypothetical protein
VLRAAVEHSIEVNDRTMLHVEHALNQYQEIAKRLRFLIQRTERFARVHVPEESDKDQAGE